MEVIRDNDMFEPVLMPAQSNLGPHRGPLLSVLKPQTNDMIGGVLGKNLKYGLTGAAVKGMNTH